MSGKISTFSSHDVAVNDVHFGSGSVPTRYSVCGPSTSAAHHTVSEPSLDPDGERWAKNYGDGGAPFLPESCSPKQTTSTANCGEEETSNANLNTGQLHFRKAWIQEYFCRRFRERLRCNGFDGREREIRETTRRRGGGRRSRGRRKSKNKRCKSKKGGGKGGYLTKYIKIVQLKFLIPIRIVHVHVARRVQLAEIYEVGVFL